MKSSGLYERRRILLRKVALRRTLLKTHIGFSSTILFVYVLPLHTATWTRPNFGHHLVPTRPGMELFRSVIPQVLFKCFGLFLKYGPLGVWEGFKTMRRARRIHLG